MRPGLNKVDDGTTTDLRRRSGATLNRLRVWSATATVTAMEHIREFVSNCDRKLYNAIRDRMIDLRKNSEIPNMHIQCNNCDHEYEQQMTLDMVSFFDKAS